MKLLLVDDNALFLEELSELLAGEGHAVATAPSVLAALDRLDAERFDVLVTDLRMPDHSGSELLTLARRRWPSLLTIILTGLPKEATVEEALALETFNYISKPFRFEWVRSTLELAAQEIAYRDRLCPLRPPAALGPELGAVAEGARVVIAPRGVAEMADVVAHRLEIGPADGVANALRRLLEGNPSPRVVIAATEDAVRALGFAGVTKLVAAASAVVAPGGRVLLGVDRDAVTDAELLGLRWTLEGSGGHDPPKGLAGPQRRAILRALEGGPVERGALADRTGVAEAERIRFYLEYLLRDGLIRADEREASLTDLGRSALGLLEEIDRSGPRGSGGNLLFGLERARPA